MSAGANSLYRNFVGQAGAEGVAVESQRARFEEILARARGRARADGFEEGVAQAEARIDKALIDQLQAIADALETTSTDAAALEAQIKAEVCGALRSFIAEISPQLAANGAASAIVATLAAALEDAGSYKPEIEISPAAEEATRTALIEARVKGSVRVDPALEPGRARIKWRSGFDEIDLRPVVDGALKALSSPPARTAKPEKERRIEDDARR